MNKSVDFENPSINIIKIKNPNFNNEIHSYVKSKLLRKK